LGIREFGTRNVKVLGIHSGAESKMTSHWVTVTLTVPSDLIVFDPATVAFTVIE
jgi:hypothetical protein